MLLFGLGEAPQAWSELPGNHFGEEAGGKKKNSAAACLSYFVFCLTVGSHGLQKGKSNLPKPLGLQPVPGTRTLL